MGKMIEFVANKKVICAWQLKLETPSGNSVERLGDRGI